MINAEIIESVDQWLDNNVPPEYTGTMSQHWARVAKVIEELGETISELILWTGQNPRKGFDPTAYERMLNELADTALTAVFALQHFTKDVNKTAAILHHKQSTILARTS